MVCAALVATGKSGVPHLEDWHQQHVSPAAPKSESRLQVVPSPSHHRAHRFRLCSYAATLVRVLQTHWAFVPSAKLPKCVCRPEQAAPNKLRPSGARVFQLAFVHIRYAWCVWWAHFHHATQAPERWERRVVNAYCMLPSDLQELWRSVPYTRNIISSWKC